MGLAEFRADPGVATTPSAYREPITQTPPNAGWLRRGLLGARSLRRLREDKKPS